MRILLAFTFFAGVVPVAAVALAQPAPTIAIFRAELKGLRSDSRQPGCTIVASADGVVLQIRSARRPGTALGT